VGVAIVTGAGSGIGAATARALAARGDSVVCADVMEEPARATASQLPDAVAVRVDVSDSKSCDEMVRVAVERFGGVDAIATCAGIEKHGFGHEFAEEDFDRIIDVNLKGTWLSARSVARWQIANKRRGTVVMIGSINSMVGNPGASDALWIYTQGTVRAVYRKEWSYAEPQRKMQISRKAQIVEEEEAPAVEGEGIEPAPMAPLPGEEEVVEEPAEEEEVQA